MKCFSLLAIGFLTMALTGCALFVTPAGQPTGLTLSAVTVTADIATVEKIKEQPVANRAEVAEATYDIAQAVKLAAADSPDFAAINQLVTKEIGKLKTPYAPLIQALVQQQLQDAETAAKENAGVSTPQADAVRKIIIAAMTGVQSGAHFYFTTPTPQ